MHKPVYKKLILLTLLLATVLFGAFSLVVNKPSPVQAAAGINEQVNYQGRLLTATGAVVPDGTYNMEFKIIQDGDGCNPTSGTPPCGGTVEWTETRTAGNKVTVKNGYFSVYLGSVTPFSGSVDWNQDTLWLSVNIGGTGSPSWDGEMEPFNRLSATPYALNSKSLGGLVASNFVQLAQGSQTDATTLSSIYINKTGASGNILELEKNGADVFLLNNTGAVTFQNTVDSTTGFRILDADGGTPIFNVDTTNERVGIGTATPAQALDVVGDIQASGTLRFGGNKYASTSTFYTGTAGYSISGYDGVGVVDRITISNPSGNVGIGLTNPNSLLTVGPVQASSATALDKSIAITSGTNNQAVGYNLTVTDGANNRRADLFLNDSTGLYGLNATASSGVPDFVIQSAGSEQLRITSGTGNVGIGDTSPASLFTVGSGDLFQVNSSGNVVAVGGAAHSVANATGALSINAATSGALNLNNTGTGDILLGGGSASTGCTITNSTGALACTAGLSGTTGLFSGLITANAGITVAGADVIAATGVQIDFANEIGDKAYWYDNTYGTGIESGTLTDWSGSQFRWRTGGTSASTGTERMLLTTTALNLTNGVGLNVAGASVFTGAATANSTLTANGPIVLGDAIGDTVTVNSGAWTFANDTTVALSGGVNGLNIDSNTLSIDATNNRVGVGTATPEAQLDVAGNDYSLTDQTATKEFSTTFTNGVANQKVDFYMTGTQAFWGTIEVEVTDGFTNQNASGRVVKQFYLGLLAGGTIYTNQARYTDDGGVTADNWAISDLSWDATNSRYKITLVHRVSTGNTPTVKMTSYGSNAASKTNFLTMTAGSVYTTDTTVYSRPYVNFLNNVGIGTATPVSLLQLGSDAGTAASGLAFGSAGDTNLYRLSANFLMTDDRFGVNRGASSDVAFSAIVSGDAASRFTVNADGAITWGGGAGALDTNLYRSATDTLKTDDAFTTGGIITAGAVGSADTSVYLCRNAANQLATCLSSGTGAAFVQGGNSFGATATLGTNDANSLVLETNNQSAATIASGGAVTFQNFADTTSGFRVMDADGGTPIFNVDTTNERVGIGTAAPSYNLEVQGTFGVVGSVGTISVSSTGNNLNFSRPAANYITATDVAGTLNLGNSTAVNALQITTTATNDSLVLYGGNVGIGTTAPSYKLDVTGSININGDGNYLRWGAGDAQINETGYKLGFSTWTGSALTEKMSILGNGNVGIGDTSPAALFTVGSGDLFQVNSSGAIAAATGITTTGNFSQTGSGTFGTGTGAISLNGDTTLAAAKNLATLKGTDYSTTGSTNDVALTGALIRLTGASAQTITGISGGTDGRRLTIVNAAAQDATISNNSGSSVVANRITTGTGANVTLTPGSAIELVYDSAASLWRTTSAVATTGGGANQQLSNLSGTVAVNLGLVAGSDNTLDLGSASIGWRTLYADTSVLTPLVDNSGALSLGTGSSTSTNLGKTGTTLTINPTAWTATPTISGLITATSGLTSTGTLTANGTVVLGDGGDDISINSNDWDISSVGVGSGFTGFASTGTIAFSGAGSFSVDSSAFDVTSGGAVSGVTTLTASGAIAANGGITFDSAADTVGAHTLAGTLDANTNILTNIGNAGTDFVASTGALNLAGVLTANGGISVGANAITGTTGIIDYTNFDVLSTGAVTGLTFSGTGGGALGTGTQALASNSYVQSRGMNLVANGTGLLGSNYNFTSFTFDQTDTYTGKGSFKNSTASAGVFNDEYIPIDPGKFYEMDMWAKSTTYVAGNHAYFGIAQFDIDNNMILPQNTMYQANTTTTLAANLNPGDTTIQLTSAANWNNAAGANTHLRTAIVWGYANSYGYTYPNNTYSRRVVANAYADGGVNYGTNTITLSSPWPATWGTLAAGTAISNGSSGGTYKYMAAVNVEVPNAWTPYSGVIGGIDTTGTNRTYQFAPGTAAVKLLFLLNRDVVGNTTNVSALSFSEVTGRNANNINLQYDTATVGLTVQAASGQTADLVRLLNSSSGVLAAFSSAGALTLPSNGLAVGTNQLVVSGGNVGIGTTPSYKLDVATSTANDRGLNIAVTSATGTNYGQVIAVSGAATTNYGTYLNVSGATNNNALTIVNPGTGANNYAIYSSATAQSYFAGNVGIGITAPESKLHVSGGNIIIQGSGSGASPNSIKVRYNSTDSNSASLGFNGLQLGNNGSNYIVAGNTGTSGALRFIVNNTNSLGAGTDYATANGTEALTILSTASVGIGDTSPDYLLDVAGTFGVDGAVTIGDAIGDTVTVNSGAWTFANDTTVALTGGVNGLNFDSNTLSIDATNDRVGIGTASPSQKLEVESGSILVDGGSISLAATQGQSATQLYSYNNADSLWVIQPGATQRLVLADAANHDREAGLYYTPGTTGAAAGQLSIGQLRKNGANWTQGILSLFTNGTERLTINSSGNVGIGDATPASLFTVGSGDLFQVNSSGAIAASTGVASSGGYTQSGSTANTFTGASSFTASGTALSVTNQAAVGSLVFTADTSARLQYTGANGLVRVDNTTNGNGGLQFGSAGDTNLYRSAANTLKTDDALVVGDIITAGSSSTVLTLTTGMIDADALTLVSAVDGRSGTSSASGLAAYNDGLSLLQGCSNGQSLAWVESTDTWDCTTVASTGANTALSNLASVAINTALLPGADNTIDLGSSSFSFRTAYIDTSVLTPLVDTSGALSLGTGSSTATNLGKTGTTLTINPTAWTATPTISGLITATGGVTANGTLTANAGVVIGDAIGDTVTVNSGAWTFANDTTVALSGGVNGINFDSNTLSIDATNNRVGIGTAAPANSLTVNGTADIQGHAAFGSGATVNGGLALIDSLFGVSSHSTVLSAYETSTTTGSASVAYDGLFINNILNPSGTASYGQTNGMSGFLTVASGNAQNISTAGGVNGFNGGVIHAGSGTISGSTAGLNGALVNSGGGTIDAATGISSIIIQTSGTINTARSINIATPINSGTVTNNYGLYINDQSSVGSSLSYNIYSAGTTAKNYFEGLVGVGDSTPDYQLDVAGTFGVDGAVTIGDAVGDTVTVNSGAWTFANDTTVALSGGVNGINFDSNTLSIDATNNRVGIGTAAPGTPLHVSQQSNGANLNLLRLENSGIGNSTAATLEFYLGGAQYGQIRSEYVGTPSLQLMSTGATPHLTIDSAGDVGINDLTPGSKLTVSGTSTASPSSSDAIFKVFGSASNALVMGTLTGSPFATYIQSGGSGVYPLSLNPNGGNVGIGDTSPDFKLDLEGTSSVTDRKIGINNTQVVYLPDQGGSAFTGSLFYGDGGNNLSHSSGLDGYNNTGLGIGALTANTTGPNNTAIGYAALYANTTGDNNTATGVNALRFNTTGGANTAAGYQALYANTTGTLNTANGFYALAANVNGHNNNALGNNALRYSVSTSNNTAIGSYALENTGKTVTAGAFVVGVSYTIQSTGSTDFTLIGAANSNVGTVFNATGVGTGTGTASSNNNDNIGIGYYALSANLTGSNNVGIGRDALKLNTNGIRNTSIGGYAGDDLTTGSNNIFLGYDTGGGITTGSYNTIIGSNVSGLSSSLSNNIIIADGSGNQRINVDSSGKVGIGDTTPDYLLDVAGTFGVDGAVTVGDASGDTVTVNSAAWTFANDTTVALSGGVNGINFDSNTLSIDATNNRVGVGTAAPTTMFQVGEAGNTGNITVVGTGTTCTIGGGTGFTMCTSDARLKDNVTNLGNDTLQKILNLRPVTYNWNETSGHDQAQEHTGLIAQEVQDQFSDSVGVIYTDPVLGDVYGVDYASLVVPAIKAIQELNTKVDLNQLTNESALTVAEQQSNDSQLAIDDLASRVEALEANQNGAGAASGGLDLEVSGMLFANGGLKVDGPSEFMGDAIFNSLVSFIGPSEFTGDANFAGRATFNSDSGGFAVIQTGKQEVKIVFDRPYAEIPVVSLTNKNGQFVDYAYKDLTKDGFTIILKDPATSDVEMSWTALSVKQAKVTVSP